VNTAEVRVALPAHLRTLARVTDEVRVEVVEPVTQRRILDALERSYPPLRGTVRDPATAHRRAFVRFYVGEADLSHEPPDAPLPAGVAAGALTFTIVGAMAGG
jgi:sulfur-carrier protein